MLKEIFALAFRKLLGKSKHSKVDLLDLKMCLLFDVGIPSEKYINEIIEKAKNEGLIEITEDNKVIPCFDYLNVEIPINFKINVSEIINDKPLEEKILEKISSERNIDITQLKKELENLKSEYPIFYPEILALYLAIKYNVDISEFIDIVKNKIKSEKLELY